ncbi:hypothetical protein [Microbacterium sp. NPDC079208]|uniref:hypothetical protein n=1 Tax=Microbacterium sp. NPDC079208 TaxID=3154652 RepID=UPI00344C52B1
MTRTTLQSPGVRRIEEALRSTPPAEQRPPLRPYEGPPPPAEVIHRQIATMAVIPSALAIACEKHGAEIGERCFDAGVCGARVARRSTGVAS